jgi:tetratricopeptide (TPR) repeat protein
VKIAETIPVALSAVLPGCGHIAAGRQGKGLLVFFLFGFSVDGYLYSQALSILPADQAAAAPTIRILSLASGILLWTYAVVDTARLARRHRRIAARADEATTHVRDGLIAYLRDDYAAAVQALQSALRIDDQDADALFHIGVAYAHQGNSKKARRALNRCIHYDHDGKWDEEAGEQLRHLDAAPGRRIAGPETVEERNREAEA